MILSNLVPHFKNNTKILSTVPGQSMLKSCDLNLNKIVRRPSDVCKRLTVLGQCHITLSNPTKRRTGAE